MRSVKSLAAAGAASLLSSVAFAADMPSIAAPPAYAPPQVEDFGGWYLRGDIGFSNQRVRRLNNVLDANNTSSVQNLGFNTAGIFGLGVGYKVNNWFRADVTGEYRGNSQFFGTDRITYAGGVGADTYHATKNEWVVLANAYVDLGTWWCITPFIGAGVGGARVAINGFTDQGIANNGAGALPGLVFGDNVSKWNLAWALHAGLAYKVNQNFTIELDESAERDDGNHEWHRRVAAEHGTHGGPPSLGERELANVHVSFVTANALDPDVLLAARDRILVLSGEEHLGGERRRVSVPEKPRIQDDRVIVGRRRLAQFPGEAALETARGQELSRLPMPGVSSPESGQRSAVDVARDAEPAAALEEAGPGCVPSSPVQGDHTADGAGVDREGVGAGLRVRRGHREKERACSQERGDRFHGGASWFDVDPSPGPGGGRPSLRARRSPLRGVGYDT
jgi:opacity protein-like surface antigen